MGGGALGRGAGCNQGHPALLPAPRTWGPRGSRGSVHCVREAGAAAGRAGRVRGSPESGPPRPASSTPGSSTTCGGGAGRGGGAEAGLPPPDVTSRLPRAYQGPPRPPPNSASLQSSQSPAPALLSCTLAARPQSAPAAPGSPLPASDRSLPPHAALYPLRPYTLLNAARVTPGVFWEMRTGWGALRGETGQKTPPQSSPCSKGGTSRATYLLEVFSLFLVPSTRFFGCSRNKRVLSIDLGCRAAAGDLWVPGTKLGQQQVRLLGNEESQREAEL